MIIKEFTVTESHSNDRVVLDVKIFDTLTNLRDYIKTFSDKSPKSVLGVHRYLPDDERHCIGEVCLASSRLDIDIIAHECIHAAMSVIYQCGYDAVPLGTTLDKDELEENVCYLSQEFLREILKVLKKDGIL